MTTKLTKPISRQSFTVLRGGRPLIVTLLPGDEIELREKGRRHRLRVSIKAVHDLAARKAAEKARAERRAKRGRR